MARPGDLLVVPQTGGESEAPRAEERVDTARPPPASSAGLGSLAP